MLVIECWKYFWLQLTSIQWMVDDIPECPVDKELCVHYDGPLCSYCMEGKLNELQEGK